MSSQQNYFPSQIQFSNSTDLHFEFNESDLLWSDDADRAPSSPDPEQSIPPPRSKKRSISRKSSISAISSSKHSSLPVNIPDWSKILGAGDDHDFDGSDEEDSEFDDRLPPHEYSARQMARRTGMVAAFSVQEGNLKRRDLRRVRNAIWKRIGFED